MTQDTEARASDDSAKDDDHASKGGGHGNDRDITVTVAAPNNASLDFKVSLHDRVDKVARKAVKAFVHDHQMESMDCGLALIINGVASPLDDSARLEETPVRNHARLVLVPKQPKTDG